MSFMWDIHIPHKFLLVGGVGTIGRGFENPTSVRSKPRSHRGEHFFPRSSVHVGRDENGPISDRGTIVLVRLRSSRPSPIIVSRRTFCIPGAVCSGARTREWITTNSSTLSSKSFTETSKSSLDELNGLKIHPCCVLARATAGEVVMGAPNGTAVPMSSSSRPVGVEALRWESFFRPADWDLFVFGVGIYNGNELVPWLCPDRQCVTINQSINQSIKYWINQSINQVLDPSINQVLDQSINRSSIGSIDQSIVSTITTGVFRFIPSPPPASRGQKNDSRGVDWKLSRLRERSRKSVENPSLSLRRSLFCRCTMKLRCGSM